MSAKLRANLTLVLVAIIWGSAFAAQRIAGREGSVFLFNGIRFLLAALVLLPFARPWKNLEHSSLRWMFAAGLTLFVASALQQAGLKYTTAGNAGFLTALYVVIVPLFLYLGWRERTHWRTLLAVCVAAVGAFLLSTGGKYRYMSGDALEVSAAIFWALHVVLLGKFAVKSDPLVFSVGQFAVCGLLNLMVGVFTESLSPAAAGLLVLPVLYTGIVSVGIGYTLQVWAQRKTPPAIAALILSLEAVMAAVSGWLILNERLEALQLTGCGLIMLAVVLAQIRARAGAT